MKTYKGMRLHRRMVTLIEVLVYGSLLLLVSGLATQIFLTGMDAGTSTTASSERIMGAFRQGDRWRREIRSAERVKSGEDETSIHLMKAEGKTVYYRFRNHELLRVTQETGGKTNSVVAMEGVQNCRFTPFPSDDPHGWKMSLELKVNKDNARIDPFFDFIAVPQGAGDL